MLTANQAANAGVHFLFLTAFWTVLYTQFAEGIARDALKGQINGAVQDAATSLDGSHPLLRQLRV